MDVRAQSLKPDTLEPSTRKPSMSPANDAISFRDTADTNSRSLEKESWHKSPALESRARCSCHIRRQHFHGPIVSNFGGVLFYASDCEIWPKPTTRTRIESRSPECFFTGTPHAL